MQSETRQKLMQLVIIIRNTSISDLGKMMKFDFLINFVQEEGLGIRNYVEGIFEASLILARILYHK